MKQEFPLGDKGSGSLEVNAKGELIVMAKTNIVEILRELAKKSDNQLDDKLVDMVALALGVGA